MIVPYEQPKISAHEQKINSILKNKNINKDNKIKLINHILINSKKKNVIQSKLPTISANEKIAENDQVDYEYFQDDPSYIDSISEEELIQTDNESFNTPLLPPLTRSQGVIDTPWRETPKAQRKQTQKRKLPGSDEEPIKKQSKIDKTIKVVTINTNKKIKKAIKTLNKPDKNATTSKPKSIFKPSDISMIDVSQEGKGWTKY
jgi:hypothetical protein